MLWDLVYTLAIIAATCYAVGMSHHIRRYRRASKDEEFASIMAVLAEEKAELTQALASFNLVWTNRPLAPAWTWPGHYWKRLLEDGVSVLLEAGDVEHVLVRYYLTQLLPLTWIDHVLVWALAFFVAPVAGVKLAYRFAFTGTIRSARHSEHEHAQ